MRRRNSREQAVIPRRIYPASSRRNTSYPHVVEALRAAGHLVHDWRENDLDWQEVNSDHANWTHVDYVAGLFAPAADRKFRSNRAAINWCDTLVLILPCGRCSHAEFGYAAGLAKRTIVLLDPAHRGVPDLMHRLSTGDFADDIDALLAALARQRRTAPARDLA